MTNPHRTAIDDFMNGEVPIWKCAGCGKPSPDLKPSCDCITGVLFRNNGHGLEHAVKIEPKPFPYPRGIGRIADNDRALMVYFDAVPTDDEMREVHECLKDVLPE